jgi:structural maintenance of chromosome 4
VAREGKKDNTSKYTVNGKTCTKEEVTKLLKGRGIDLDHNRFLILQGEVEQISLMKPKAPNAHEDGLLEYLEDIIGTNKLVEPINDALKGMEELNEQRATKLTALKAAEQNVRGLEGRKAEAETYLRTEAQLNSKRSAFYQKNAAQASAIAAEVETKRDEIAEKLKDEQSKSGDLQAELKELEKTYKRGKKDVDKCAEQLDTSRKEFQKFEREDIKHREELKSDKNALKRALSKVAEEERRLGETKSELGALMEDIPRLEGEAASLNATQTAARTELESMYDALKGQTEPLRVKIEAAQKKRDPEAQALATAKSEEAVVKEEKALLEKKLADVKAEAEAAQAELEAHGESTKRSREEFAACQAEEKELEAKISAAKQVVSSASEQEEKLGAEAQAARAKYEEGKAATSSNSSRARVLQGLMAAKKSGKIPGVIGRLGALGSIAPEYDVAASTACGALDNVVVDTTTTAQACVQLLREKELGVCTFIILDKQQQQHGKALEKAYSAPAGSQRLFDLLQIPEPAHRAAFYSAFRDTLVCADKAKASSIALGGSTRHRVVTTDGVVINPSGTMEGGGKPSKGRIGPSAADAAAGGMSEKELAKQLQLADAASAKLEQLKAARAEAANSLRGLQKDATKVATALKKLKMGIEAADTTKKALEERVERTKSAAAGTGLSKEEAKRQTELDSELKKLGKKVTECEAKVDKIDGELASLQEEVLAVGGVRLRAQKSKVETLGDQLSGVEARLNKAKAQAEGCEKVVAKGEAAVEKAKESAAELEKKIEATKAAFKKLEDDAFEVMQSYEACQTELSTKEAELEEMKATYEEAKKSASKVLSVENDMKLQLEDYSRSVHDNQKKAKHWQAKLAQLRETLAEAAETAAKEAAEAKAALAAAAAETGEAEEEEVEEEEEPPVGSVAELSADELEALDAAELASEIAQLEEMLQKMDGNLSAIQEYRAREREYKGRAKEFDVVTAARDEKRHAFEALRKERLDQFMAGFKTIGMKLKEMYQMITLGGDAELELLDSLDPFSEGIVFSVRPPKKSWKNIANLSGGEKTLSSLALVFALHHFKPTPLYVMDEIDAALDFRNVSIVGNYIKERTRNAQFIIISLRNNMFELADRLVGIYKTQNATKSVAINPAAFTITAR